MENSLFSVWRQALLMENISDFFSIWLEILLTTRFIHHISSLKPNLSVLIAISCVFRNKWQQKRSRRWTWTKSVLYTQSLRLLLSSGHQITPTSRIKNRWHGSFNDASTLSKWLVPEERSIVVVGLRRLEVLIGGVIKVAPDINQSEFRSRPTPATSTVANCNCTHSSG